MVPIISIAPMLQWTDRHYRMLIRNITQHTLLYTEMVMDDAITHNLEHLDRYIGHSKIEHPLAIQLGGKNIEKLTYATKICDQYSDFTHINLNCGCPSNKALSGGFGAELMCEDPEYVRQLLSSMRRVTSNAEVTVKCRIGTTPSRTEEGTWNDLVGFVEAVKAAGVRQIVIHARTCILKGLSPAQNRTIPPLQYDVVYRLIETYPELSFILNGGIKTHEQIEQLLNPNKNRDIPSNSNSDGILTSQHPPVDGVMIGRQAYNYPWTLRGIDAAYYSTPRQRQEQSQLQELGLALDSQSENMNADADMHIQSQHTSSNFVQLSRYEVIEKYLDYCIDMQNEDCFGATIQTLVKPLHNIFAGCPMHRSEMNVKDGNPEGNRNPNPNSNPIINTTSTQLNSDDLCQNQNLLYDINYNKKYKNKLDGLIKDYCKIRNKGFVTGNTSITGNNNSYINSSSTIREIIHLAIEDTIPEAYYYG